MCTRTKGGADVMRYRPIRRNSEFGRVYARGKSYVNPALEFIEQTNRHFEMNMGNL